MAVTEDEIESLARLAPSRQDPDIEALARGAPPLRRTLSQIAADIIHGGLEIAWAPMELAGESIRSAAGRGFKAPSDPPEDFITATYGGLRGLARTILETPTEIYRSASKVKPSKNGVGLANIGAYTRAGTQGLASAITLGQKEIDRPKETADKVAELVFALIGGAPMYAPLTATYRGIAKAISPALTAAGRKVAETTRTMLEVAEREDVAVQKALEAQVDAVPYFTHSLEPMAKSTTPAAAKKLYKKAITVEHRIARLQAEIQSLERSFGMNVPQSQQEMRIQDEFLRLKQTRDALASGKAAAVNEISPGIKDLASNPEKRSALVQKLTEKISSLERRYEISRVKNTEAYKANILQSLDDQRRIMSDLGATTNDINARFVNVLNPGKESIVLPETVEQARTIKGITPRGVPVEKSLVQGIERSKDISHVRNFGGTLNFTIDYLDRMSNGAFRRHVFNPILEGIESFSKTRNAYMTRSQRVQEGLGLTAEDSIPLRLFIEQGEAPPVGKEKAYQIAAGEFREMYDDLLGKWNARRKSLGMPEVPRRDDYVTHTREISLIDELFGNRQGDIPDDVLKMRRATPKVGFEKKRFDAIPESELSGLFEAFDVYANKVLRFNHFSELGDKVRALERVARKDGKHNMGEWLKYLGDRINGDSYIKTTVATQQATGGSFTASMLSLARKALGVFSRNAVTSLNSAVNQVGSTIQDSIYIGTRGSLMAVGEGLAREIWGSLMRSSVNPLYQGFAEKYSKTYRLHLIKPTDVELKGNIVAQVFSKVFSFMNDAMVSGVFNQSFKMAWREGYSFKEAVATADRIALKTQAGYNDILKPSIISSSSEIGKQVLPLSTYVFNAFNSVVDDVALSGLPLSSKINIAAKMTATGLLLNVGTSVLTGKDTVSARDLIPAYRIFEFGLSGPAKAIMDPGFDSLVLASPVNIGGSQLILTRRGIKSVLKGEASGPADVARRVLFGPPPKE